MAKKSLIAREAKRARLVKKHATRRAQLRKTVADPETSAADQWEAMMQMQKLPRDSARVRQRNRCELTGRPHGYFRKFGLCRNQLREVIMRGEAPGVVKSSW